MQNFKIIKVLAYFVTRMLLLMPMLIPASLILYLSALVIRFKGKKVLSNTLEQGAKSILLKLIH